VLAKDFFEQCDDLRFVARIFRFVGIVNQVEKHILVLSVELKRNFESTQLCEESAGFVPQSLIIPVIVLLLEKGVKLPLDPLAKQTQQFLDVSFYVKTITRFRRRVNLLSVRLRRESVRLFVLYWLPELFMVPARLGLNVKSDIDRLVSFVFSMTRLGRS